MEESKSVYLSVASILAWIWGILMLFSAIAVGIPVMYMGESRPFPILVLVIGGLFGGLYCFSGYGLRKKRRVAGVVALIVAGLILIFNIISPVRVSLLVILVNLAIIILVLIGWKELA